MGAAHDRLPWGPALMWRESLKEASRCMIQASADVRVENPSTGVFTTDSVEDGFNGIHRASSWSKTIEVRLKACLPLWFQGCFNHGLHYPGLPGWYAQG